MKKCFYALAIGNICVLLLMLLNHCVSSYYLKPIPLATTPAGSGTVHVSRDGKAQYESTQRAIPAINGTAGSKSAAETPYDPSDSKRALVATAFGTDHAGYERQRNIRNEKLIWAARSRMLTAKEMEELKNEGAEIFIRFNAQGISENVDYPGNELRYDELLMQQFKFAIEKQKAGRK